MDVFFDFQALDDVFGVGFWASAFAVGWTPEVGAVNWVVGDWVAEILEVDADLVGSAREGCAFSQGLSVYGGRSGKVAR